RDWRVAWSRPTTTSSRPGSTFLVTSIIPKSLAPRRGGMTRVPFTVSGARRYRMMNSSGDRNSTLSNGEYRSTRDTNVSRRLANQRRKSERNRSIERNLYYFLRARLPRRSWRLLLALRRSELQFRPNQLAVSQSAVNDRLEHVNKTTPVVGSAIVEPMDLLVNISEQVKRVNTDISSFDRSLEQG